MIDNTVCNSEIAPNEEIARAWVLIQAPEADEEALKELSSAILAEFDPTEEYQDSEEPAEPPKLAIRADIMGGDFQMAVSISAATNEALDEMIETIGSMAGGLEAASLLFARVELYNPSPSTCASAYVTESEAYNPTAGLKPKGNGHNAWG